MIEKNVRVLGPHGFYRMMYTEWGDPNNSRVLICVHGLTRNRHDFDELARQLADDYRILCPDVPGRGQSDWFEHKADYSYSVYVPQMAALIARSGADSVDWLGTSMGGLIGLFLAAQPRTPIRRLILNDIGPFIPKAGLERIAGYVGNSVTFTTVDEAEQYLRVILAPFGHLSDAHWQQIARHSVRLTENGQLTLHYDLGIAEPLKARELSDVDLWSVWETLRGPVLVLRGAQSDVLTRMDAERMQKCGPKAELVEFEQVGHAPALMNEQQIEVIRRWLMR